MTIALGIIGLVLAAYSAARLNKMFGAIARINAKLAAMGAKERIDIGGWARVVILAWITALLVGVGLIVLSAARLFSPP